MFCVAFNDRYSVAGPSWSCIKSFLSDNLTRAGEEICIENEKWFPYGDFILGYFYIFNPLVAADDFNFQSQCNYVHVLLHFSFTSKLEMNAVTYNVVLRYQTYET